MGLLNLGGSYEVSNVLGAGVAAVIGGLFGVTWLAVLLLIIGSVFAVYALIVCKRCFSSESRL